MKSEVLKLVLPFLTVQVLYWSTVHIPTYYWSVGDNPGLCIAVIKSLPVSSLALYLGTSKSNHPLIKNLLWGMMYSIGGDFCLVFPNLFLPGMAFFLAAQISFIKAFSFEKLVELCLRENCCDIVVERARKIVQESKGWQLT